MSSPFYPRPKIGGGALDRLAPAPIVGDMRYRGPVNSPTNPQPAFNPRDTFLGTTFKTAPRGPQVGEEARGGRGDLPDSFDFSKKGQKGKTVDVVHDYPWTLSKTKGRKDIPYIRLSEHRNNQSLLKRQALFYTKETISALSDAAGGIFKTGDSSNRDTLATYKELWPDNPTGWNYLFPYFTKTQFELQTSEWQQVDSLSKSVSEATGPAARALRKLGGSAGERLAKGIEGVQAGAEVALAAGTVALQGLYPVVGINDRPRVFSGHNSRSITIEFPLYNTLNPYDYINNRDFYYIFASQNLFAKRNFITGLPPVFYRVYVPGQYFSFASCITDFSVTNLGNLHFYEDERVTIPDAYQIRITLSELLMPSLNQYSVLRPDAQVVQVMGGG